jgi:hypothetical protein
VSSFFSFVGCTCHGLVSSGMPRVEVDSGIEVADKGLQTGNLILGYWMGLTVWNR